MIASLQELLLDARRRHAAVGAFTAYNVETAIGVVRAAEANNSGVILLVSKASLQREWASLFLGSLVTVAARSEAPVCVQLDHVDDPALVELALEAGAGAIMADGSRRPFAENVELVRSVSELARPCGAQVEAELGHIEGDEDVAVARAAGALTDPEQASEFLVATQPQCLAVSIGNVHGRYAAEPDLDWARLDAIRTATDIPLSLHGASGLPDADLVRAVRAGISKFNINTDLRAAYFRTLRNAAPELEGGLRLCDLDAALIDAVAGVADAKVRLLLSDGASSSV